MNKLSFRKVAVYATLVSICSELDAQSLVDRLESAVSHGSAEVSLRARLETVEQENALQDATAATLRSRLTLKSGEVNGFEALVELDNVSTIGADHYDSFVANRCRGRYSVIADPVGSEVNQAYLNFSPDENQHFSLGKQRVNHAAQRFIGSVAWRQNEQTLDAFRYSKQGMNFSLDYSYVWNVNRIFASSKSSVQAEDLDSASHIAYSSYKTDWGTLAGFLYLLDFDNAAALSSRTYGLSYAHDVAGIRVNASIARQSDYAANPASYDANYFAADASYDFDRVSLTLGYESLGSDGGLAAFQTPLATLHKWQGWTDLFLSTPDTGIEDSYITLGGKIRDMRLTATYHSFSGVHGGGKYGREWDMIATYPLRPNLAAELKYASYDSDGFSVDTDKLWFSLNLSF